MKSRTSFFNKTVFRKNLTRFAPAWGLYTLCLLMGMLMMADSGTEYWFVSNLGECIQVMVVVNLFYGLLVALLLFGDLYNSRMCNALHAMPLRREGWFLTNVVSGLTFSLLPTFIMTVPSIALSAAAADMAGSWQVPLYWLLGTNLSFLFFFGLAVLCVFCVGNRFAMAVVYGILNSAAYMAYSIIDILYTPLLYGIQTWDEPFMWLTPLAILTDSPYIECVRYNQNTPQYYAEFIVGEWWYLWLCAGIGAAMMAAALMLYRKRKLESAGDFIAVKVLEPVFLVVYTLCAGMVFYYFNMIFSGDAGSLFLFLGLIVGFFTGRMFLKRTVRVFQKRAFFGCAALLAAIALSLGITALDPLGIESWMPKAEEVESVTVNFGHYSYNPQTDYVGGGDLFVVKDDADIEKILHVHELAIEAQVKVATGYSISTSSTIYEVSDVPQITDSVFTYTLTYKLTSGRTVSRYYRAYTQGEAGQILGDYFSSVECVLGAKETELAQFAETIDYLYIDNQDILHMLSDEQLLSLLEAIAADCREGNMVQRSSFHDNDSGNCGYLCDLNFEFRTDARSITGKYLNVYQCCEHTAQWLKDNDMEQYFYSYQEKYYD